MTVALGGFAAGLSLSRRFFLPLGRNRRFAEDVERDMKPIVQLFTPIFFVAVGLSLDLGEVQWGSSFIWLFSLSVGCIAIAGKVAGGYLLVREHWLMRSAIGMAMVPRGKVGLIGAHVFLSLAVQVATGARAPPRRLRWRPQGVATYKCV